MVSAMFAGIGLLLLAAGVAADPVKNGFDLGGAVIPADAIVPGGPPRDSIPASDAPKFIDAGRARHVRDDDWVLGLRRHAHLSDRDPELA